MAFLYRRSRFPLENLCGKWQVIGCAKNRLLRAVDALVRGASAFAEISRRHLSGAPTMLDLVMLAIGLGFFALSVGYVYACERL
jgi:hypothetical protein